MPIITVQSFSPTDPNTVHRMLSQIQIRGASALRCPPSNLWVVFEPIPAGYYVQKEGNTTVPIQESSHPPIITVRANAGRTTAERTALVSAVAEEVGDALSIPPENIWIHYQEMSPRDIWFDGHWSG